MKRKPNKFDESPVSRKEVEAIKKKLKVKQNKQDALKIAKAELKAEKKALAKKAEMKRLKALTGKEGATVMRKRVSPKAPAKPKYSGLKSIK